MAHQLHIGLYRGNECNALCVIRLFTGSYGNIMRVKILFNKKDTALVQYSDPMMAQNGTP